MAANVIYGMARFCKKSYGYGSFLKKINKKRLIKFLNYNFKVFECADRYKKSVIYLNYLKKKKTTIHYKIDNIPINKNEVEIKYFILNKILKTLRKLNLKKIDVLYLHQNSLKIINSKKVINALKNIKKRGLFKNLGVSIYNEQELYFALNNNIYKYIQIPINMADTYLYFKFLKKFKKKIIVARSIFLQGTLTNLKKRNIKYNHIKKYVNLLKEISTKHKINYEELIVRYIFSLKRINYVLIGSIDKKNINQALSYKRKGKLENNLIKKINQISKIKKNWSNPQRWA